MLSKTVIQQDARLEKASEKAGEELARHRWHWTLDESNADRVSLKEYAREVGRSFSSIKPMVNAYVAWREASASEALALPGQPVTLHDFTQRERLTTEQAVAVEAVAEARGTTFGGAAHPNRRPDVDNVRNIARDRAARHGTAYEDEVREVAQWQEGARKVQAKTKADRAQRHTFRFIAVEEHLGKAYRALLAALNESEGVDWPDEERDLIVDTLGRVKAVIGLVDLRIAGSADVDWDAELAKLDEPQAGAA